MKYKDILCIWQNKRTVELYFVLFLTLLSFHDTISPLCFYIFIHTKILELNKILYNYIRPNCTKILYNSHPNCYHSLSSTQMETQITTSTNYWCTFTIVQLELMHVHNITKSRVHSKRQFGNGMYENHASQWHCRTHISLLKNTRIH